MQYLPSNLLYNKALKQNFFAAGSQRACPMITQHKFTINNVPRLIGHRLALHPSPPARGSASLTWRLRSPHPPLPAPAARSLSRTPVRGSSSGGDGRSRGQRHGLGHGTWDVGRCCHGTAGSCGAGRLYLGLQTQGRMRMKADMSHLLKCGMEWDLESAGLSHQLQT